MRICDGLNENPTVKLWLEKQQQQNETNRKCTKPYNEISLPNFSKFVPGINSH